MSFLKSNISGDWKEELSRNFPIFSEASENLLKPVPLESIFKHDSNYFEKSLGSGHEEIKEEESPIENKSKQILIDTFGFSSSKKKKEEKLDLERFDERVMNENLEDQLIQKLKRKVEKMDSARLDHKKVQPMMKAASINEIQELVQHPDFDTAQISSYFIAALEKPSLNRIESIIQRNKENLHLLEEERQSIEHSKKARLLESAPNSRPQRQEISIYDLPIQKLMKNLKSRLEKKEGSPPRKLSQKIISYEKGFKHFLKKKREKILGSNEPREEVQPLSGKSKSQTYKMPNKVTKDELELISYFYEDIPKMDDNYVLKSDVCKYLLLNPRIMELFNLAPGSIDSKLAHFSSEKPGCLSFREFCHFLKSPRDLLPSSYYNPDKVDHLSNAQIKELPNTCLLSQETINLMENKFNEIDKLGDRIVSRKALVNGIRKDPILEKELGSPAVFLSKVGKILTLNRMLIQIEKQEFEGDRNIAAAKSHISWLHFLKNFNDYKKITYSSKDKVNKGKPLTKSEVMNNPEELEMSFEILSIFRNIFDNSEKSPEGYLPTQDLLSQIKAHPKFKSFKSELARSHGGNSRIKSESIAEALNRVSIEADDYLDWDEFLDFFTKRGRPLYFIIDKDERNKFFKKRLDEMLSLAVQKQKFENLKTFFYIERPRSLTKSVELNENNENLISYESEKLNNSTNIILESRKTLVLDKMLQKNKYRITIPDPFDFEEREKEKNIKTKSVLISQQSLEKIKEEEEYKYIPFKANPIPNKVRQKGLFDEIMQGQEERRVEVKKRSKAITKQNERPFSFMFRENNKRVKSYEREKVIFKANPAPWLSSLRNKLEIEAENEEFRRQRIMRNAVVSLSLSKLPPRMQLHEKEKSENPKKSYEYQAKYPFYPGPPKDIPDFKTKQRIFQELLESKRGQFKSTVPISPLQNRKKSSKIVNSDEESSREKKPIMVRKEDPIKLFERIKNKKPELQAGSTKKWEDLVELRKRQAEEKLLIEEEKLREEEFRLEKAERMRQKVKNSAVLQSNIEEHMMRTNMIKSANLEKLQNNEKSYAKWLREMEERLEKKGLLLEGEKEGGTNNIQNLEDLQRINELLGERDLENLEGFNEQEKELINEMRRLKEHGLLEE